MLELRDLSGGYGDGSVLNGLSLTVEEGQVVALLGRNGAGKTTTMRVITGYHPPTSGTVTVAGYDIVTQAHEAKRQLGYLPEHPPLYLDMTVAAYLDFVASLKEVPRKARKSQIEEIVEMLSLDSVYRRLIRNISKGYRQRVGLAQALVGRPPVLILDEPTVGLDPKQIHEVREIIRGLGGRHTIILSSHILPEVSMVCGRVAIINKGRIVAVDTPDALSARLGRSHRVIARIAGEAEQIREAIARIDGVLAVHQSAEEDGESAGAPRFVIETESDKEIRPALFYALAELKAPLLELRKDEMSLEDVFLQLTTEESYDVEAEAGGANRVEEVATGA